MDLSVQNICKSFNSVKVLESVDFSVHAGEICALLGENGAGKSTLMNIIGGLFPPDSGDIFIDGKNVSFSNPAESLSAGIAFIHQELNLVNDLTVYENMFLSGFPKKKKLFLDRKYMISHTAELFDKLGINIDPCAYVRDLDASYKQMVEISRALLSDAKLIIMDEPTSSLTSVGIEKVFAIMRNLKEKGISMIFISHKLGEVMEICDRFTVLRNGVLVESGNVCDVTPRKLASFMVGHEVETDSDFEPKEHGDEILKIENLSDGKNFFDISLSLGKGEVLGITGLLGDGRSELFGTVFGLYGSKYDGKILLNGKEIHPSSTHKAIKYGIAYLPKNRKENAIISDMSILDNGTSAAFDKFRNLRVFFDKSSQSTEFKKQSDSLRIKMADQNNPITTLSGGNQQKTVLARCLVSHPQILILDNPTQGVDVGAKEEIYSIIRSLAETGISVVILSSESQEIIKICDRSLVMYHGRIVGEVKGESMNEQNIMYLATGGERS